MPKRSAALSKRAFTHTPWRVPCRHLVSQRVLDTEVHESA